MNQLKAGAILNYINIAVNIILGLLYTPYMLDMLGQNEYGLYSLVASVISYLTLLDFGFGSAVVRYTAKYRAEGKIREQWEMFGMFFIVYLVLGMIAFIAGMGLYYNVDNLFDRTMTASDLNQARIMMLLLVVNLAVTFPLSMFGSIITAYENFIFQKVVTLIRLLASTGVIVILLFWGYKAVALVVVHTIFNIGYLIVNFLYARYKLQIKVLFSNFNLGLIKEISVYSFWQFLNSIMDKIYWSTGQFILGSLVGTVAVAIFSVAITLQSMYMTFSGAIASVMLPRVTTMVAQNASNEDISDLFIRTGRIQNIVMSLILVGFIVFGYSFITLWAGADYSDSYLITVIFFAALYIPLIQNTGIAILQARNQQRFRCLVYVAISIVSLFCQIWLAKLWGALGVAIAVGGALLIGQGLIINIYYGKVQRIDIPKFWREILRMSVMPIILAVAGLLLLQNVELNTWLKLGTAIVVFMMIYIPLIWRFSLNNHERQLISVPINKIINKCRVRY